MRKIIAALFVAALAVLGVSSAQAASSVTVGGSCTLDTGVKVSVSATFANTSGSPSRGTLKYLAMSSKTQLTTGNNDTASYADPLDVNGNGHGDVHFVYVNRTSDGVYHYRSPSSTGYLNLAGIHEVLFYVVSGSHSCPTTPDVKSKN